MKKIILLLALLSPLSLFADDLADWLQDLAVQTACLGRYSMAQTGVKITSRYDDPPNWYDEPMMANRFASMSGDKTMITTFYGICFNYAQFAWNDIKEYQDTYNDAGMKNQEWYIAAVKDDPYTIILYDPIPEEKREKATAITNGVYVKEKTRYRIYAHGGATNHAWLWVQHKDGTWYWIDPTWTDNTGYIWWGKVENGREVQYEANPDWCVNSDYEEENSSGNNGGNGMTIPNTETYPGNNSSDSDDFGDSFGFSAMTYSPFNFSECNFSFEYDYFSSGLSIMQKTVKNLGDDSGGTYTLSEIYLDANLKFPMFNGLLWPFVGGGIGLSFDFTDLPIAFKLQGGMGITLFRHLIIKSSLEWLINQKRVVVGIGAGFCF